LRAQLSKLQINVDNKRRVENTSDSRNDSIKCWKCNKKVYKSANCPQNGANSGENGSSNNQAQGSSTGNPSNKWKYKPPGEGEADTKEKDGVTYSYCKKCRRWTFGDMRHTTDNHRSRGSSNGTSGRNSNRPGSGNNRNGGNNSNTTNNSPNENSGPSGALATSNRAGLRLFSSMMLGSVTGGGILDMNQKIIM